MDRFACFAACFSSFPKENAFQNFEENLSTINRKTEFPDFSLTLTISKIFPDFLKKFPDLSLTVATLSDDSSCNTEDTDFVFNNQGTKFVPYIKLIVRLFDAVTFGFSEIITQNI